MTQAQELFRKQLLVKIHTHKEYKQIKLNGAWEDFLSLRFGVDSCKVLSISELNTVLECLNGINIGLNFVPDTHGRAIVARDKNAITNRQIKQIEELCATLGLQGADQTRFFYKQTGALVTNLSIISKAQATKIITGLKKVCEYRAKR